MATYGLRTSTKNNLSLVEHQSGVNSQFEEVAAADRVACAAKGSGDFGRLQLKGSKRRALGGNDEFAVKRALRRTAGQGLFS